MSGNPGTLVLVRHGESEWNALNLFAGWVDVDLTHVGHAQATRAGQLIAAHGLLPDKVHTSVLRRAITSAQVLLDAADRHWVPTQRTWRLNERHYGALQGLNKAEVRARYADEQFQLWRRSYAAAPPPIESGSSFDQRRDVRYAHIDGGPTTESLADVVDRLVPYVRDAVVPDLRDGKTVLIVAHSNSLRALVKHLDRLSDEAIVAVNIPTGVPLRYDFDTQLRPRVAGGTYLDPTAAALGIAAVAAQGYA